MLAAIVGNTALTAAKFGAFAITGSGSMFSEAIHSLADTGNQALLFFGIRQSERPADHLFPYGYGGERFLYALLSAIGIFVLGCGFTVYHGVHNLLDPPTLEFSWWSVGVLAVALVVEGTVLSLAVRTIAAQKGERSLVEFVRTTNDPTIAAVLLEDSVACLGVLVAAAGMGLSLWTGNPVYDALGAIAIGGMLGLVAVFLGMRNRTLLLGPTADPADVEAIVRLVEAHPAVRRVRQVKSRLLGSHRFRVYVDVEYDGDELGRRAHAKMADDAWDCETDAGRRRLAETLGRYVCAEMAAVNDALEADIRKRFPGLAALETEADGSPPLEPAATNG